ncbi:hypothetical protein BJQ97_02807 [Geobacillus sp. TFV-3]|nr:hypothetical protein BJQ97_02807 [Geobacillus sp. TFV-3]
MLRKELRAIVFRPKVFVPDLCCSVHSSFCIGQYRNQTIYGK